MRYVSNFVRSERQMFKTCVRAFLPPFPVVAFRQGKGSDCSAVVSEGDAVREGQLIAVLPDGDSVHSPVPGTVDSIFQTTLPDGKLGTSVKIRTGGSFSFLGKKDVETNWHTLLKSEILDAIKSCGVVNTFFEPMPLFEIIEKSSETKNNFLVVRMFDEDPGRLTDSFVAQFCLSKVTEGACITARAMGAAGIVFVLDKNQEFNPSLLNDSVPFCAVRVDASKYPAGFRENIITAVRKNARLPEYKFFSAMSRKSIFIDPETALSVYEAVVLGKPVIERFVHVTGNCLRSAAMMKVRIGTSISSLAEQCGGFKIAPAKISVNGLITGKTVADPEVCITKSIKSVSFIPSLELFNQVLSPCIRCGKCRSVCPEHLYPDLMYRSATEGLATGNELKKTAALCSLCNLCSSACPARLPLSIGVRLLQEK